jgi:hypothetical protein
MQMTTNELLSYIIGDQAHPFGPQLAEWMAASPRFKAFVTTYRNKIRKKIRGTRDAEGLKELSLELETAFALLRERRFEVEYEKYGVGKARGPDFAVTFRSRLLFNLEVTRLRAGDTVVKGEAPERQYEIAKLIDAVCGKLGQMLPSVINVLAIFPDDDRVDQGVVMLAMARLKERAERKDGEFLARKGFDGSQDFFKHYQRLSAILVRSAWNRDADTPTVLWANPQARHPLPPDLRVLLGK